MLRLPVSLMSPGGASARLSILIFHRVLPAHDPLNPDEPDAGEFEQRMRWVRSWFDVLPLGEAVQRLRENRLPARAMSITFDDGYADNEAVAAPILQRLGLPATFFISTGYLDGGCMWNDRVIEAVRHCSDAMLDLTPLGLAAYPLTTPAQRRAAVVAILNGIKHLDPAQRARRTTQIVVACGDRPSPALMMSGDQLRRLRASGMEIGAHTVTHPILTRLDLESARSEMAEGKAALERLLGEPVSLFAYPNGVPGQDYAAEHARLARECGFEAAVSTAWGAARAGTDLFQLPRFTPWDRSRLRFGARLLANLARRQIRFA
ncbi:polysaccharide deacetylase family protein [Variovorax sp. YR752]|uniref:polysaccharide deacetylase family protein n=1 Tax=Variovorax sp. YR752 TaxID=1884383 RepID=UPI003137C018